MPTPLPSDSPVAFLNGQVLSVDQLALDVHDQGFLWGATVSERLRTFGHQPFQVAEHLERLKRSLEVLGIDLGGRLDQLPAAMHQVVEHNIGFLAPDDELDITVFVTPGVAHRNQEPEDYPTVCCHTRPINFARFGSWFAGEHLVVSRIRQTLAENWPLSLKCRSRLHYYLADREVREQNPAARALLLHADNSVAEATTATVFAIINGQLVTPPRDRILDSISLAATISLAKGLGLVTVERVLSVADLAAAEEVLLCSTSPCVWPAITLNGVNIGDGKPGPLFERLLAAWNKLVGLDIRGQATR